MKKYDYILSIMALSILFVFIGRTFSNPEQSITSIVMQRGSFTNPGDFKVEKKAEWVDMGRAQITFDVNSIREEETNNKDLLIVIDVSGSMRGKKLDRAKADAIDVVNKVLQNPNSRVALVSFSSATLLKKDFTNDKEEILRNIDGLYDNGDTSYLAPLKSVTEIMAGYQKRENTDLIMVFLTDGLPNWDNPNEVSQYQILKERYPYMSIHGIQYEMGNVIYNPLKRVSDYQWVADVDTLNKVLHSASQKVINYDKFVITDYINSDLFEVESEKDIVVPIGEVKLEEENGVQKITWDLGNKYVRGQNVKMIINAKLKDQYLDSVNYSETNKKESVEYKIPGGVTETITSEETPRLQRDFRLIYDPNVPEGCVNPGTTTESHFSFEHITKSSKKHSCKGYYFGGWEIVDEDKEDIKIINDDVFLMPNHDVTLRGIWKKATVNKNMNGEVKSSVNTLYEIMRSQAVRDDRPSQYVAGLDGIDFTQPASETNGHGAYMLRNKQVISDEQDYPILYYRGKVDNTNVLFAGYCWQIVRSTPDKGIRLLFNGDPTGLNHDQCDAAGDNLYVEEAWRPEGIYSGYDVPILGWSKSHRTGGYMHNEDIFEDIPLTLVVDLSNSIDIQDTVYFSDYGETYGDSYEYDPVTDNYKLIGKHTCYSSGCSAARGKYVMRGGLEDRDNRVMYVSETYSSYGYYQGRGIILTNGTPIETLRHVPIGTDVRENADGTYTLTGVTYMDYTNWHNNYSSYKRKYVCPDYTETCASPSFISDAYSRGGTFLTDSLRSIYASTSTNGERLVNPVLLRLSDWLTSPDYTTYNYICADYSNNCSKEKIYYADSRYSNSYNVNFNRIFGKSVTWDGQYYHLVDTIDHSLVIDPYSSTNNKPSMKDHHYVCQGFNQNKCEKVLYIFSTDSYSHTNCSGYGGDKCPGYYLGIVLENGETDVVAKFNKRKLVELDENKNVINGSKESPYKYILDRFYEDKLLPYDRYIDDAVWCNSKTATEANYQDSFLGGNSFNQLSYNGGLRAYYPLRYNNPLYNKPVLECDDKLDAFTVNDTKNGNGYLKHPIALITTDEFLLGGLTRNDSYLGNNDSYYFTLTPAYASGTTEGYLFIDGSDIWAYSTVSRYVKPSIVLKPNIEVLSGDGTKLSPYILDTSETD